MFSKETNRQTAFNYSFNENQLSAIYAKIKTRTAVITLFRSRYYTLDFTTSLSRRGRRRRDQ